jgi:hypothetical protein
MGAMIKISVPVLAARFFTGTCAQEKCAGQPFEYRQVLSVVPVKHYL